MNGNYSGFIFFAVILHFVIFPGSGRADEVAPTAHAPPVYALVVGNNQASEGQVDLRYADDDAVQNAAFMAQVGGAKNVTLLATLDAETTDMYPGLHPEAPSKKNIQMAMEVLNRKMMADRSRGLKPEFFLFYTGHGNVRNNAGYISTTDGRFTRDDLLTLVRNSEATRNHLIIDACKSYFMVFERGPGGSRRKVTGTLVSEDALPANTGVFLSTSSAANSHEWEAISAGVFSHEVRSALRGGADLDLDKQITYEEAAAFIWNANRGIPLKKFRPAFFMQPPPGEPAGSSVLANLTGVKRDWLYATPASSARQFVEDSRGNRIAEFHPGTSRNISILIPPERPLFVRRNDQSTEYEIPPMARVELTSLVATERAVGTRGAENLAFQELFSTPFSPGVLSEYYAARYNNRETMFDRSAPRDGAFPRHTGHRMRLTRNAIGVSSVALAGAGLTMTLLAFNKHNAAPNDEPNIKTVERNDVIRQLNTGAAICYMAAGITFSAWLIWTIAHRKNNTAKRAVGARNVESEWSFGGTTFARHF